MGRLLKLERDVLIPFLHNNNFNPNLLMISLLLSCNKNLLGQKLYEANAENPNGRYNVES